MAAMALTGGVQADVRVGHLRCEYRENPRGIDEKAPRLSWIMSSAERGQKQTAYQVQAASSMQGLAADGGDLWDSGKVESDQSVHVAYAGRRPVSHQECWWKVRVWDKDGKPSSWSGPAMWSVGILDPTEWQAKWIGFDKPYDENTAAPQLTFDHCRWIWYPEGNPKQEAPAGKCWFRRAFDVRKGPGIVSARVLISVDDGFTLFLNGARVGGTEDGEGEAWQKPRELDIAAHVKRGRNVLAVEATNTSPSPAGLICRAQVEFEKGPSLEVVSDGEWRVANAVTQGWQTEDADDTEWATAAALGPMGVKPWGQVARASQSGWRQKAPSPVFRKTFGIDGELSRAVVYTCGLGYHDLYINGQRAGDAVLQPPFTRYDRRCIYTTHDVTELLKEGNNALGVMLGNGFYNVHTRAAWDFDAAYWRKRPRLLLQLHLFMKDGSRRVVATGADWKASTGPLVYDGVRQGEVYDARLEQSGWSGPAFDDAGWGDASVVEAPGGVLSADIAPPIRVVETIEPERLKEVAEGVFVYDLGQNIAGWVRLKMEGDAGTQVRLRYSERLRADGTLEQGEIAKHVRNDPFQTDTYILRGGSPEVYEPRFVYHGFQYVEITGYPGTPTLDALQGCVVQTDFKRAGSFACSNPLLNDIQRLTDWAYRGNYVGIPTDCPHREKNGWTGDAHLAAEQAMFNWHNEAAYTKWIIDFADEQRPDGVVPAIIPTGGWGYRWGNGPAWDSAYLLIPWYMYLYEGDTRILERHYEGWKRYVDYLMRCSKQGGIVSIGLGDWAPAKSKCPVPVTSTGYYYTDTRIVADAARILGRKEDAEEYGRRAAGIRAAFEKAFAKGNGLYADGSQTALSCAVYQGFVESADVPAVIEQLVTNIRRNDGHIDTGILGSKYLFHALSENGAHETAYRIVTREGLPGYAWWVERGATTMWENWDGHASLNHIMFGDISAWFYRQLAGIQVDPANPGFKHFVLKPQPVGDLTWVKAHHDCPYGRIVSHWRIENGRLLWRVVVPPNTTATLHVPVTDAVEAAEAWQPIKEGVGLRFVRAGEDFGVFIAESGEYAFDVPWSP